METMAVEPPQIGWTDGGSFTRDPRRPVVVETLAPWRPCPTCWGQRQVYVGRASETEIQIFDGAVTCPTCLGLGDVPSLEGGR